MDKKAQTIATYNTTARQMAAKFRAFGVRVEDIERGFSLVGTEPNVLEIGCGDGRDAKEIFSRAYGYEGMDVSEEMLELAREHVPGAKFVQADVETYDFPKNIDLIFSFASLLHSDREHVALVLGKALRALNPGGVFYISLKHGQYHEETKTDEFGTRTYYFYTPEDIEQLAQNKFTTIYLDIRNVRGQKWFTIALRRK